MTKDMEVMYMKEAPVYTVEREFLGKITLEELVKRIIQSHSQKVISRKAG